MSGPGAVREAEPPVRAAGQRRARNALRGLASKALLLREIEAGLALRLWTSGAIGRDRSAGDVRPSPGRSPALAREGEPRELAMKARILHAPVLAAVTALAGPAAAAVPLTITHQGRLFNAAGQPITDTLDVVFALYDALDAPVPIWSEAHTITFDDGYFSVDLGELAPVDKPVRDGTARYLGITVGNDPEMIPRARVASVPYALQASNVAGDITPNSVSIAGRLVIDSSGLWVGEPV